MGFGLTAADSQAAAPGKKVKQEKTEPLDVSKPVNAPVVKATCPYCLDDGEGAPAQVEAPHRFAAFG